MAAELIEQLLLNGLPNSSFSPGEIPGMTGIEFASMGFPGGLGLQSSSLPTHNYQTDSTPAGGAYLRMLSPSVTAVQADTSGDVISWGSEVELPEPGDAVPPPRVPPTINVQAPTDSNYGKSQREVTPSAPSRAGQRTPRPLDVRIDEEPTTALPDPRERDLPAPPPESVRLYHPSPVSKSPLLPTGQREGIQVPKATGRRASMHEKAKEVDGWQSKTGYLIAHQDIPGPINTTTNDLVPWDLVTQRLYSWALVWEEESFVRALENISLGNQVSITRSGMIA